VSYLGTFSQVICHQSHDPVAFDAYGHFKLYNGILNQNTSAVSGIGFSDEDVLLPTFSLVEEFDRRICVSLLNSIQGDVELICCFSLPVDHTAVMSIDDTHNTGAMHFCRFEEFVVVGDCSKYFSNSDDIVQYFVS
jgi:hypothetical protein